MKHIPFQITKTNARVEFSSTPNIRAESVGMPSLEIYLISTVQLERSLTPKPL